MYQQEVEMIMEISQKKKTKIYFKDAKGRFIAYLDLLKKRINKLDYDCFIVVVGKERRGKSTFAAQLGYYMTEGNIDVSDICMDAEEFTSKLQSSIKGGVIIFDEAGTNLYSREAMSSINRMLTKAFMVSGLKNICIIICIPSFFSLDTYIRTHRVDLLCYVPKRGKFKAYSTKRAKLISLKGAKMKNMNVVRPNEVGWFRKDWPDKELYEEYHKKEVKYKMGYIKDLKNMLDGYFTTGKFCQITGYSMVSIYRWIKANRLKHKKVGKRYFILKSEADRLVQENQKYSNIDDDSVKKENEGKKE